MKKRIGIAVCVATVLLIIGTVCLIYNRVYSRDGVLTAEFQCEGMEVDLSGQNGVRHYLMNEPMPEESTEDLQKVFRLEDLAKSAKTPSGLVSSPTVRITVTYYYKNGLVKSKTYRVQGNDDGYPEMNRIMAALIEKKLPAHIESITEAPTEETAETAIG